MYKNRTGGLPHYVKYLHREIETTLSEMKLLILNNQIAIARINYKYYGIK